MLSFSFCRFITAFACVLFLGSNSLWGQNILHRDTLIWSSNLIESGQPGFSSFTYITFKGADFSPEQPQLPRYHKQFALRSSDSITDVSLKVISENTVRLPELKWPYAMQENYEIQWFVSVERSVRKLNVIVLPLRKTGVSEFKLEQFELEVNRISGFTPVQRTGFKDNSVLVNPGFIKLSIPEAGIYRIDQDVLRRAGINPDQINPRNIRIFSSNGGMVPELNSTPRTDDLEELALWVQGENDERFDANDFVLFYSQGPEQIQYNTVNRRATQATNVYDNNHYVYLNVNLGRGKRIGIADPAPPGSYSTAAYDTWIHYEQDLFNIGHLSPFTTGAGKQWYGDNFRTIRERNYNGIFIFPGRIGSEPIHVESSFAGRASQTNRFHLDINGQTRSSNGIGSTNLGNPDLPYARPGRISDTLTVQGDAIEIRLRYPDIPGIVSEGWLDFITVNARCSLTYRNTPLYFRDFRSLGQGGVTYRVSNGTAGLSLWNITDLFDVKQIQYTLDGQNIQFTQSGNTLQQFVLFNPSATYPRPEISGPVSIQNLHSIQEADMLIVYHPAFESEVIRLAEFRANETGLKVIIAPVEQIYNEFSGGRQDAVAIRDFARMLYNRDQNFRYLLLFGDATFDYRNILRFEGTQNHVPCWQTEQSLDPIFSFPADDFFGLLDPDEGGNLRGAVDIAVGRLPANNIQQARTMVDKILSYESDPETRGDWKLQLTFMADDEDANRHINDADDLTEWVKENHPVYNIEKIYFDAFPQIATPGGERFPAAKEAINKAVFKGNLIMNYFGHGGPTGLAQERVLEVQDINSWTNINKLMLMVTATCTFGSYDNPFQTSAGELALLNPRGGAVGMMTTTRAVYASSNRRLTFSAFRFMFDKENGRGLAIGEILRRGKNATSEDTLQSNARKFILLGDPATELSVGKYDVRTLRVNGRDINPQNPDTLKALNRYTIDGAISDENGNIISSFNGTVDITIFDKEITLRTLGQNASSFVREFSLQRSVIFRGKATVRNGLFSYTFIVPKSINYAVGPGKISYYAWQDNLEDASGFTRNILIGSTGSGEDISKNGPEVQAYMNDFSFVSGGITNENPILLAKITAENGINISGASIGHDLSATLDSDDRNVRILNDFFQGEVDDFTKGEVRFPLFNLEEGPHQIRVKAFDVAHNPGEGVIDFTVVKGGTIQIKNLFNYPNPFTSRTSIQFEHNLAGNPIDIQVQIFTISGQLVRSLEESRLPHGFLLTGLDFNGLDNYGQRLANGVYLYKVKLAGTDPSGKRFTHESDFQKMVLLN